MNANKKKTADRKQFNSFSRIPIFMKGTIISLFTIALELTLCLLSSRWGLIDVNKTQICFKPLLNQYNISPHHHQHLYTGPLFSTSISRKDPLPSHFPSDHAKTECILLMTGIGLIVLSAIVLSSIEFCLKKSLSNRSHLWLHLLNVFLLTASLILLIIGFHLLQHIFKQPLNGAAALGFFLGILFIVILATHSAITFWSHYQHLSHPTIEKVIT